MFLLLLLAAAPTISLDRGTIVVTGFGRAATVAVYVEPRKDGQPAVLGTTTTEGGKLVFTPRFPLTPGVKYRVVVGRTEAVVGLPKVEKKPTTTLTVFPSADVLPENQLKFYLHFSTPMAQGDVYRHIKLIDDKGKAVLDPFLEQLELWDASGTRFTLFFDPGRIKRGLTPRETFGPPLVEGRTYTLVIDRAWLDEDDAPMKETFKKTFMVAAPDDTQPDIKTWKVAAPASDKAALKVTFPESMEHALSQRMIWVTDAAGERIAGEIKLSERETVWTFTPAKPWKAGAYQLVADTRLEDLAGNSIGRPFEVDVLRPVEKKITTKTVSVPFRVK